jgi:hypothetical protein
MMKPAREGFAPTGVSSFIILSSSFQVGGALLENVNYAGKSW